MNEMKNKYTSLLEEDQALCKKILEQQTLDAAYALAEHALPGLTFEEFCEYTRSIFANGQALSDDQLEVAVGGRYPGRIGPSVPDLLKLL